MGRSALTGWKRGLEWRMFHHLFQLLVTGDPILGFLAAHGNRYVFLEPCQWQANQ